MVYQTRKYPLLSACGLNCGLCPRYYTEGKSKCPGCAGEGFLEKHPSCGILSCCQRHGVEYCYLCDEYQNSCKKYDGADANDSFITHLHQLTDFDRIKSIGLEAYQSELNEKVDILRDLLTNYNDGRQKSFFCIAVNLLDLQDVRQIMEQITYENAIQLFKDMADKRNMSLKLRKKANL